jgi:hypothetical protein
MYRHVYALPEEQLADLVYMFDTRPAGLTAQQAQPLRELVDRWVDRYPDSGLHRDDDGASIVVVDHRVGWPSGEYRITDPALRLAYLELEHGRSPAGLRRRLAERGVYLPHGHLRDWLAELAACGLVFAESGQWIALATRSEPIKMRPA